MKENKNSKSLNRRKFVKNIGVASGAAAFGLSGVATAESSQDDLRVSELEGAERKSAISDAITDSDFEILSSHYDDLGWGPNVSEATATYTSSAPSHRAVVIPFEAASGTNSNSGTTVNVLWVDLDKPQLSDDFHSMMGYHIQELNQNVDEANPNLETTTATTDKKTTRIFVRSDEVHSSTNRLSDEVSQGELSIQDVPNCPPGSCYRSYYTCNSYNVGCILQLVAAAAGTAYSCGSCYIAPTNPSCIGCITGIIGGSGIAVSCDVGSGCHTERRCLTC